MSGGFFRGTSADQDTRFSNKEAKLLKSQKFPAELDQLVDMSKVKMDVIRPWIANRTTEFLGFEDEVLINFIYGLLDGKEVDGKQIQIQLTGFMEKNTVKFMKELWALLTSAQKNASGIPQQFLDAKAEETRKKKAEADRINYEVQKKKEEDEKEVEKERQKKINADLETAKIAAAAAVSSRASGKDSLNIIPEEEMAGERRSSHARGKNGVSRLSHDGDHSPPQRSVSSSPRSRSPTNSISKSQSRSPPLKRRHRSRSISRSPRHRRRSPSPIRRPRSPIYSPPRRKRSPLYARSPRRRSPSPWRRRLPSPRRRRSPSPSRRRRSPSPPLRKRSPSPPPRRRSPSPRKRRSPSPRKRRSPSPPLKRSPTPPPPKRRSPSPLPKRRSPSPTPRTKLPAARSPVHYRPSPACSPRRRRMDSQSPPHRRKRSPQYRANWSPSRDREGRYNEVDPRRYRDKNVSDRARAKRSPDHDHVDREEIEGQRRDHIRVGGRTAVESAYRQNLPVHPRSPQRDVRMRSGGTSGMPESPPVYLSSPNQSPSPHVTHMNEEKRRPSPHRRQMGSVREQGSPHENIELRRKPEHGTRSMVEGSNRRDAHAPNVSERKDYGPRRSGNGRDSPTGLLVNRSGEKRGRQEGSELKKTEYRKYNRDDVDRSPDYPQRRRDSQITYPSEGIEYGPGRLDHGHPLPVYSERHSNVHRLGTVLQSHIECDDKEDALELRRSSSRDSYADGDSKSFKADAARNPIPKPEAVKQMYGSDSGENEGYRRKHVEKRKARRELTAGQNIDDEDGNMSSRSSEERREAKRRKKEERRLRKEEKRRRREERHRRKEERRASKVKAKTVATVERDSAAEESEDDYHDRDHSQQSQDEEMEDEQKRLEIELRRKALESLRAKKAISH